MLQNKYRLGGALASYLFPAMCYGCRRYLNSAADALCISCWQEIEFISGNCCDICQSELADSHLAGYMLSRVCYSCQQHAPYFDRLRCLYIYGPGSIQRMILAFKHGDSTQLAKYFAQQLFSNYQQLCADSDLLIPVPIHYSRLLIRRYNQAGLLANRLGKLLALPTYHDILLRQRATPKLADLSARKRYAILAGAFVINDKAKRLLSGKRVLLVDDVVTTGQTINLCSKKLKSNGASKVTVVSLARSSSPLVLAHMRRKRK